jgi:hypothetical protein
MVTFDQNAELTQRAICEEMTMMTTRLIGVLIVCAIFCAEIAQAGSQYDVTCEDEKCGFKTSVDVGGGFEFDQIQGYCRNCSSSVTLSWKRGKSTSVPSAAIRS